MIWLRSGLVAILKSSIRIYQLVISPAIHLLVGANAGCRFEESCSRYSVRVIEERGPFYGSALAIKRICSCHPFSSKEMRPNHG